MLFARERCAVRRVGWGGAHVPVAWVWGLGPRAGPAGRHARPAAAAAARVRAGPVFRCRTSRLG